VSSHWRPQIDWFVDDVLSIFIDDSKLRTSAGKKKPGDFVSLIWDPKSIGMVLSVEPLARSAHPYANVDSQRKVTVIWSVIPE
jgi:hypothetical protein